MQVGLRRALHRKTDLAALPQIPLNAIIADYSNTPKKMPRLLNQAKIVNTLHFKCESKPASRTGRRCGLAKIYHAVTMLTASRLRADPCRNFERDCVGGAIERVACGGGFNCAHRHAGFETPS